MNIRKAEAISQSSDSTCEMKVLMMMSWAKRKGKCRELLSAKHCTRCSIPFISYWISPMLMVLVMNVFWIEWNQKDGAESMTKIKDRKWANTVWERGSGSAVGSSRVGRTNHQKQERTDLLIDLLMILKTTSTKSQIGRNYATGSWISIWWTVRESGVAVR